MSRAAKRQKTRVEDFAYCLMRISDVNIPLLYGESDKAFVRLQEETMRDSDDHTLFVWVNDEAVQSSQCSLLASSSRQLKNSVHFKRYRDWNASRP